MLQPVCLQDFTQRKASWRETCAGISDGEPSTNENPKESHHRFFCSLKDKHRMKRPADIGVTRIARYPPRSGDRLRDVPEKAALPRPVERRIITRTVTETFS